MCKGKGAKPWPPSTLFDARIEQGQKPNRLRQNNEPWHQRASRRWIEPAAAQAKNSYDCGEAELNPFSRKKVCRPTSNATGRESDGARNLMGVAKNETPRMTPSQTIKMLLRIGTILLSTEDSDGD